VDPLYIAYHDMEWGVPELDDAKLFELLCLEGAQAGLSWITVLRKRHHYRAALDGFDAARIARYTPSRLAKLMQNPGLIRNRLKIESLVSNARAYLDIRQAPGAFASLLWDFRPDRPRRRPRAFADVPVSSPESDAMSRELKRRGFRFVGTTICYAFMQASGIVDDHQARCHRAP
jgi:DNA-3-methyladenine glycosylase I